MRMPRATVNSTTTATTMSTIKPAKVSPLSSFVYERGSAVDPEHLDPGTGLEGVVLVVGAGAPHLSRQPHCPAIAVHPVDDHGRRADQRRRARAHLGRHVKVAAGDRPQHEQ